MTLQQLFDMFVKNWGPQAGGYAILLFVIFVLARKYDSVMRDRVKEGVQMALALQDLTKTIEALRELIKDRKP